MHQIQPSASNDLFGYRPPVADKPTILEELPGGIRLERGFTITSDRSDKVRKKWKAADFDVAFRKLEIGGSFSVKVPAGEEPIYTQNAVSGAASTYSRKFAQANPNLPRRIFTTRQQPGGIVRCWRTQ